MPRVRELAPSAETLRRRELEAELREFVGGKATITKQEFSHYLGVNIKTVDKMLADVPKLGRSQKAMRLISDVASKMMTMRKEGSL